MKFAIVTGVSRGLGLSIAKLFMEQGVHVFGISRNKTDQLSRHAADNNVIFKHYSCDLADNSAINATISEVIAELNEQEVTGLYLVNNAGVIEPVDQAMNIRADDIINHIQINLTSSMLLMNAFLKKATMDDLLFIGATVSSGAAERPVDGWSAYCSSKAAVNMYTKTVALEQDERKTENKIIAFSPGIMDTDMQKQIRSSTKDEFAEIDKFKAYKENDLLRKTDTVAGVLVDIITDESSVINGKIYNVTDYV
ncbi:(S)-benzoin forming benzil reductase [Virgibacillus halodenitrificans]|uniref:(S)-benzoin forming benzil reductase n=1 Tax=Virgibacillus halodenitrificans TaxID=1482 RepID=UPI001FB4B5C4|nr:(S)-benzoin forming benzil reductase [Virgibacillus halodenitrificans]MCJ0932221.1 (S)-benzoin forming benzil reductase [Virgibacillus halodenitrificans]